MYQMAKKLPNISTGWVGLRTLQTDDRQTDGRAIAIAYVNWKYGNCYMYKLNSCRQWSSGEVTGNRGVQQCWYRRWRSSRFARLITRTWRMHIYCRGVAFAVAVRYGSPLQWPLDTAIHRCSANFRRQTSVTPTGPTYTQRTHHMFSQRFDAPGSRCSNITATFSAHTEVKPELIRRKRRQNGQTANAFIWDLTKNSQDK